MEVADLLRGEPSRDEFLESVFPTIFALVGGESGGLVRQQDGVWRQQVWFGNESAIPGKLGCRCDRLRRTSDRRSLVYHPHADLGHR